MFNVFHNIWNSWNFEKVARTTFVTAIACMLADCQRSGCSAKFEKRLPNWLKLASLLPHAAIQTLIFWYQPVDSVVREQVSIGLKMFVSTAGKYLFRQLENVYLGSWKIFVPLNSVKLAKLSWVFLQIRIDGWPYHYWQQTEERIRKAITLVIRPTIRTLQSKTYFFLIFSLDL